MKKVLAMVLCLTMLLACVPAMADEAVYTTLYGSEVSTLNYLTSGTTWDQTVGANVIDTLVEYSSTAEVIPGLAERWDVTPDQKVWTFYLRQGQKWYDHNGKAVAEVTAQDFVDAMKYVLDPDMGSNVEYAVETARILNCEEYYNGEITDFEQVGVKALDTYTLQYTLSAPVPYFLSCLTYGCFMPAYGPQLAELGTDFATAADKMYYCGAFILSEFEPQVKHVYVKNTNNWDAANVHLDKIVRKYNPESGTIAPEMALRGEIDVASIDNSILSDWQQQHGDILSRDRAIPDYSYFYCFNFDPTYDAEFGPDNWLIAVNNANFRHSIMSAFDRVYAMYALEPDDPEALLQHSITPATFCTVNGVDFAALPAFDGIDEYFYNYTAEGTWEAKALKYKAAAMEELTAAGCTFPVTVVLTYKSGSTDWENESMLVKEQLEAVLGTDYINVELYAGPSESFLSATRRAGKYSIMRCNWGADYADPETWTDPFDMNKDKETGLYLGNSYNKMDKMLNDDTYPETKAFLTQYYADVAAAKAITDDMQARYNAFAAAEASLIKNAMVIPYNISAASYQVTKLNIFEGEFAPFGMSNLRYKYQTLHDSFITAEEYEAAYSAWLAAMGN